MQALRTCLKYGVDDGARTHDRRNHNPELYQLSYAHHFYHLPAAIIPKVSHGAPGRTRTCNPQLRRLMLYPIELRALRLVLKNGRGGEIRTPDPLLPKQLRYQAALHPELPIGTNSRRYRRGAE